MKQHLYFILCLTLATSSLHAQEARHAFVNMPDSILSILTPINRADCIDFLDSHMRAVVKNRFDQESEMTHLSKDYIAVRLSPQSYFEMKLLPITDSTNVICTIQTVCSNACDSHIQFYTSGWHALEKEKFITLPTQTDFIPDAIPSQVADTLSTPWETLRAEADVLLMHASLADSTSALTFQYTTPQYMSKESASQYSPLLKQTAIRYEWVNGKFIRQQ